MKIYAVVSNRNSAYDYDGSYVTERGTVILCQTKELAEREMQKCIYEHLEDGWFLNKCGRLESPEGYNPESCLWYEIEEQELICD